MEFDLLRTGFSTFYNPFFFDLFVTDRCQTLNMAPVATP